MAALMMRRVAVRSALATTRRAYSSATPLDVLVKAKSHNIRLSQTERSLIERDADARALGGELAHQ